jgi:rSAM/selenodomain-associated transferase 1
MVPTALFIFLRFPLPGKVKTRLAQSLGKNKAAWFYRLCADAILSEIRRLPEDVKKYVFYTDQTDEPEIRRWVGPEFTIVVQEGEDLGQRLKNAFGSVFNEEMQKVIAVASDVPDLSADIMNKSIEALDKSDVVIGPCYDGGYYLLGMKRLHDELFSGISWSTEHVYRQTLAASNRSGLNVGQIQTLMDIDTEEDIYKWSRANKCRQSVFDEFLTATDLKSIKERL